MEQMDWNKSQRKIKESENEWNKMVLYGLLRSSLLVNGFKDVELTFLFFPFAVFYIFFLSPSIVIFRFKWASVFLLWLFVYLSSCFYKPLFFYQTKYLNTTLQLLTSIFWSIDMFRFYFLFLSWDNIFSDGAQQQSRSSFFCHEQKNTSEKFTDAPAVNFKNKMVLFILKAFNFIWYEIFLLQMDFWFLMTIDYFFPNVMLLYVKTKEFNSVII